MVGGGRVGRGRGGGGGAAFKLWQICCSVILWRRRARLFRPEIERVERSWQVHNPWGRGEWTGRYSDKSPEMTPALLAELKSDVEDVRPPPPPRAGAQPGKDAVSCSA